MSSTKRLELYEINTETWLYALSQRYRENINLVNVPTQEWDHIAQYGFNSVWLMGVWERSPAAAAITRADTGFMRYLKRLLPDFDASQDVSGSPYAIRSYTVDVRFGGPEGLAVARAELKKRGLSLILDYVPNHVAPDHVWVTTHPDYFIQGSSDDLRSNPPAYTQVGDHIFATGRNQEVYPWVDVLQLNAFSGELRQATAKLIASLAAQCDGLRCDAAMLMLNQVFSYTWQTHAGEPPEGEFWSGAISAARAVSPDFLFIAETYWHTEQQLLDLGFDYCFDKNGFYDAIADNRIGDVFHLLLEQPARQRRMIRGLENHDERRAATAFGLGKHKAAAVLIATTPGSSMYYEGQFDGVRQQMPVQVRRDAPRKPDASIDNFYTQLLTLMRNCANDFAEWRMCNVVSKEQHIASVLAWSWQGVDDARYLVVINWNKRQRRVTIRLPWQTSELSSQSIKCIFSSESRPTVQPTARGLDCHLLPFQAVILKVPHSLQ